MKRILTSLLFLTTVSLLTGAQQTPDLLIHAAQCLAAKQFLPRSKPGVVSLGYMLDSKAYPGKKVVYVVNYLRADRSKGEVFSVFVTEREGQQVFNVQNNASFIRSKRGVDFPDPPLGGVWTQAHLISAIRDIERQPDYKVQVGDLLAASPGMTCEAYTDNAVAVAQQPTPRPETRKVVWTWSQQCSDEQKLGVTVRLERKVLYRGSILICRGSPDAENGRAEFRFAGGHRFQGEYRTLSADSIKGDIWQAGGEPDALILGISFENNKQILLNTLHVARPDKQTSSELDKGLFITTYPVSVR